ncbi:MAG: aminotransferase class III-fold pyridoxal phosphate-dependent enzyme [Nannocystaceae bacterium]|nr:aspartate aminotransferase family protein [Myxococcales bacterium]
MLEDLRWPTYPTRGVVLDAAVPDEARGGGALRVRDIDGNVYLDAVAGIGCGPLGHSHPLWCEAVARQLTRMTAASNTFNTVPQLQLVARLIDLFPVTDARAFLCSTGTEATEAAIKLALRATGRDTIVACERAFHGRTLGALSLTANPDYRAPYITCPGEPVEKPSFVQARALRFPYNDLDAARAIFEREGSRIAAVFVEPIQGEAGVFPATREFLVGLRRLCDEHGALLGADEVQSGVGRTGHWAAWTTIVGDDPALRPDLLWLAKALGGGMAIGACLARAPLAAAMVRGSHGTTFGGNPLAATAAVATLRILEEEGLLAKASAQLPILRELAQETPIREVTALRGHGAMIGVQIGEASDRQAASVGDAMMDRGVLVTVCGGHTVRLLLPYHAGREELAQIWRTLADCLREGEAA